MNIDHLGILIEGTISQMVSMFTLYNFTGRREFHEIMAEVADQRNWDGKSYGGHAPFKGAIFAGGLSECVMQNMYHFLGLHHHDAMPCTSTLMIRVNSLVVREAMRRSPEIDLFVRSVISGAKVVGHNFQNSFERESLEVLESLL